MSSLGHTVLFPTLFRWHNIVAWQSQPESPWLAFVVMLHVGSAIGLLIYFWRDWVAIIRAFFATLGKRRIETPTERLAWLIVGRHDPGRHPGSRCSSIPIRVALAKPLTAAIFLMVNGCILLAARAVPPARRGARARSARGAQPRRRPQARDAGVPGGGRDRRGPGKRADRRNQPRRRGHDRRPGARAGQRRRRPLRLPARHSADPRRRPLQASATSPAISATAGCAVRPWWRRCSRP